MRCSKCGVDAKKSARSTFGGCCPSCRHPFVTHPQRDGVTDLYLQNVERGVSGLGAFHFLLRQFSYEILRRTLRRGGKLNVAGLVLAGLAAVALALSLQMLQITADTREFEILIGFLFLPIGIGSGAGAFWCFNRRFRFRSAARKSGELAARWLEVNPSSRLIESGSVAVWTSENREPPDLGDISFDRVLICDRDKYVDFFLANRFHFHYSCPVLGGSGYPNQVFPDMMRRLKKNPDLAVFIVHDLTHAGLDFAERVSTSSEWFGDHPTARVIDLGLDPVQLRMFRRVLVPLSEVDTPGSMTEDLSGLPRNMGAELTVFRPEMLIRLVAAGIEYEQPFHLLPAGDWGDRQGYG